MKKRFQTALCFFLILSARISLAGPCLESYKGDMSGESGITLADAVIALEILAGTGAHAPPPTADVDGNRTIGLEEVVYVLQVAAALRPDIPTIQAHLESEFQKAGTGLENYPTTGEFDLTPFTFKNNLGPNGADEITIRYAGTDVGCGDNPDPSSSISIPCDQLPPLTTYEDLGPNQSQVEIFEELNDSLYSAWGNGCYCNGEILAPVQANLPVLIKTPPGHSIFAAESLMVTGINTIISKIQFAPYQDLSGELIGNHVQTIFPAGSSISFFNPQPIETVGFYVSSSHTLIRHDYLNAGPKPLFDNVRDLQIAFGLDRDQDGIVDDWIGDDPADIFDTNADLFEEDKDLVVSICLMLIE